MSNKSGKWVFFLFLVMTAGFSFTGCKKEEIKSNTTEAVNIVGYLDNNIDSFSLFRQILDKTDYANFLNAYGTYTCFAPTNSGVSKWLTLIGAANVEAADVNILKEMVKFHVLPDTLNTGSFKDGKLPVATMQGQFLITGVTNSGEGSSYTVNRQAVVTRTNVPVGNGIVHVINNVLVPSKLTIAQQLEADPNYAIFVQALKETGFFTVLNTVDPDTTRRWKTVLAESNQALRDSGITSYAALKARYSKPGGNPINLNDSLHIYVAYHIVDGLLFLGDIITNPTHLTAQPQEVVSTQLINQEVLINQDVFDNVVEPGVLINRSISDNAATNGVWHAANAHFTAKLRKPASNYWEVCTFPELMKLTQYYKKAGFNFVKQSQEDRPVKDIDWHYTTNSATMAYEFGGVNNTSTLYREAVNWDILDFQLGPPNRALWFEMTTPVIIKGRYKVWVCYAARNAVICNVKINGQLMQRPVNFGEFKPAGTDAELESIGWKQYTVANNGGRFSSRLVGVIDIPTTQRHVIRFEATSGTSANGCYLDMIQFIPVDENQVTRKYKQDGTWVNM